MISCVREIIGKDFQGDLVLPTPYFISAIDGVLVAVIGMRYIQEISNELHPLVEQQHRVIQVLVFCRDRSRPVTTEIRLDFLN